LTDLAELLFELVAVASPSGEEARLGALVGDRLLRAGLDVEHVGASVLARLATGRGPRLLLNTHLDTVPVGAGWTRDPAGAWEGERLYGRGANDAKASVAAMLHAVCELASARGALPAGEVWLALTACEETTNAGMQAVLERAGAFDGAVTGEPTGLDVVRAQSGLAVIEAVWAGRSCHAAHVARVEHESALAGAVRDLARAVPFLTLPGEHALLGPSTVVPTVLRSGERHNVVPDRAEALFDARLAPPHDAAEVAALLRERLPGADVRVRSARLLPVETAEGHPLVRAALAAAGRARAVGSSTMSDMALLAGTPAVKCGPGLSVRSHTPDEFVTRPELEAGAAFYRRFAPAALEALAAVGSGS
jgi:acetylornithine deacetylase